MDGKESKKKVKKIMLNMRWLQKSADHHYIQKKSDP
jgi:hypothetical protein